MTNTGANPSTASIRGKHFRERARCPVCDSANTRRIADVPYNDAALNGYMRTYYKKATDLDAWLGGASFRVDRCLDCTLAYQATVGDEELLGTLYDQWLNITHHPSTAAYRSEVANAVRSRDGHELLTAAHVLGAPVNTLRVFDYGMGWGLWLQIALSLGARAFGYDLSSKRCEEAAARGVEVTTPERFHEVNADFVNADQILEHCADPKQAIREIATSVRRGGLVKISVPRADDLESRLASPQWNARAHARQSLHPIQPLEHVNCFTPKSLARLCSSAGLMPYAIPLRAYLSFLTEPHAAPWTQPKRLAKAFARPAYNVFARHRIYAWFVRM